MRAEPNSDERDADQRGAQRKSDNKTSHTHASGSRPEGGEETRGRSGLVLLLLVGFVGEINTSFSVVGEGGDGGVGLRDQGFFIFGVLGLGIDIAGSARQCAAGGIAGQQQLR